MSVPQQSALLVRRIRSSLWAGALSDMRSALTSIRDLLELLVSSPVEVRFFDFVYAVAMRSGRLQTAINRYKYQGATGWASIFGRVLVGYLDDRHRSWRMDGIIASRPSLVLGHVASGITSGSFWNGPESRRLIDGRSIRNPHSS